MKTLQNNFLEAYKEAVQSIKAEGKKSRLCRFYEVQEIKTQYGSYFEVYSSLFTVYTKYENPEENFVTKMFENNKSIDAGYNRIDSYLAKKLSKTTKSTFYFKSLVDKTLNNKIEKEEKEKPVITASNENETRSFSSASKAAEWLELSPKSTKGIYTAIKTGKEYKNYYWAK